MAATLFSAAAHINAVWPRELSRAFTSALASINAFSTATSPVRAAVMSTVSPPGSAVFGSAPPRRSRSMIRALPLVAASESGVTP